MRDEVNQDNTGCGVPRVLKRSDGNCESREAELAMRPVRAYHFSSEGIRASEYGFNSTFAPSPSHA